MRRVREIDIDHDAPWDNDDLQRKSQGKALKSFIVSLTGAYTIALKSPWGSGKSTFLRRLDADLELHQTPVVLLDAWANDYVEDPLLAFVSALQSRLEKSPRNAKLEKKILALGIATTKLVVPTLLAVAKGIVPGLDDALDAAKEVTKTANALLEEHKKHKESVQEFRSRLEDARDYLSEVKGRTGETKLVFLIDELDRCRPDFAVRVLERIKHFFDVPGITFVIATDESNLPAAIARIFGASDHSERYLRKFIDFEFRLAPIKPQLFVDYLCKENEVEEILGEEPARWWVEQMDRVNPVFTADPRKKAFALAQAIVYFPRVSDAFGLPLRDQIQAFTMIVATIRAAPADFLVLAKLLVVGCCLRFIDNPLYEKLVNGEYNLAGLLSLKGSPTTPRIGLLTNSESERGYFPVLQAIFGQPQVRDQMEYLEKQKGDRQNSVEAYQALSVLERQITVGKFGPKYFAELLRLSSAFSPSAA
jgi:hypothetical protein